MNTILDEILINESVAFGADIQQEELNIDNGSTYLPFMQSLVRLTRRELNKWGNGKVKETSQTAIPILRDYYRFGVHENVSDSNLRSQQWQRSNPWSAVFISWLLRTAGAGPHFRYSKAHWRYIANAKQKRERGEWRTIYWAYRISERKPRLGDLVCNSRAGSGLNYDNVARGGSSHCDIVTDVLDDRILVVGGNVNDSVKQKTIFLNGNGFIDSMRHPNHFSTLSIY